jgi:hypothetical protein
MALFSKPHLPPCVCCFFLELRKGKKRKAAGAGGSDIYIQLLSVLCPGFCTSHRRCEADGCAYLLHRLALGDDARLCTAPQACICRSRSAQMGAWAGIAWTWSTAGSAGASASRLCQDIGLLIDCTINRLRQDTVLLHTLPLIWWCSGASSILHSKTTLAIRLALDLAWPCTGDQS